MAANAKTSAAKNAPAKKTALRKDVAAKKPPESKLLHEHEKVPASTTDILELFVRTYARF